MQKIISIFGLDKADYSSLLRSIFSQLTYFDGNDME